MDFTNMEKMIGCVAVIVKFRNKNLKMQDLRQFTFVDWFNLYFHDLADDDFREFCIDGMSQQAQAFYEWLFIFGVAESGSRSEKLAFNKIYQYVLSRREQAGRLLRKFKSMPSKRKTWEREDFLKAKDEKLNFELKQFEMVKQLRKKKEHITFKQCQMCHGDSFCVSFIVYFWWVMLAKSARSYPDLIDFRNRDILHSPGAGSVLGRGKDHLGDEGTTFLFYTFQRRQPVIMLMRLAKKFSDWARIENECSSDSPDWAELSSLPVLAEVSRKKMVCLARTKIDWLVVLSKSIRRSEVEKCALAEIEKWQLDFRAWDKLRRQWSCQYDDRARRLIIEKMKQGACSFSQWLLICRTSDGELHAQAFRKLIELAKTTKHWLAVAKQNPEPDGHEAYALAEKELAGTLNSIAKCCYAVKKFKRGHAFRNIALTKIGSLAKTLKDWCTVYDLTEFPEDFSLRARAFEKICELERSES